MIIENIVSDILRFHVRKLFYHFSCFVTVMFEELVVILHFIQSIETKGTHNRGHQ